jgi:hypothetical protein
VHRSEAVAHAAGASSMSQVACWQQKGGKLLACYMCRRQALPYIVVAAPVGPLARPCCVAWCNLRAKSLSGLEHLIASIMHPLQVAAEVAPLYHKYHMHSLSVCWTVVLSAVVMLLGRQGRAHSAVGHIKQLQDESTS